MWHGLDNWDRRGRGVQRRCPELGVGAFALDAPSLWQDIRDTFVLQVGPLRGYSPGGNGSATSGAR